MVLEVDEHQDHQPYACESEQLRMVNLSQALGLPPCFWDTTRTVTGDGFKQNIFLNMFLLPLNHHRASSRSGRDSSACPESPAARGGQVAARGCPCACSAAQSRTASIAAAAAFPACSVGYITKTD